jgi:hypothetical protein
MIKIIEPGDGFHLKTGIGKIDLCIKPIVNVKKFKPRTCADI